MAKAALVCGAGGFIGSHLVKRLKREGFWVRGVDLKFPSFSDTDADDFIVGDLRDQAVVDRTIDRAFDEVYQLAADMGGAGYIFTGEHDAHIMHNSATINLNVADRAHRKHQADLLFVLGLHVPCLQSGRPRTIRIASRSSAYPAAPDSEYGWEKLFSERLFLAYNRNYGMSNRVARYHNIFGPRAPGRAARRRRRPPSAARSRWPRTTATSKSGATASRRGRSSTSTNASKARSA